MDKEEFTIYNNKGQEVIDYKFDRIMFSDTGYVAATASGFRCVVIDDEGKIIAEDTVGTEEYLTFIIEGPKTKFITTNNREVAVVPSKRNIQEEVPQEEEQEETEEEEEY